MARRAGFKCSPNTVLRLMGQLDLNVTLYSRHTSGYHSYKGKVGTVNDNLLHQQFNAQKPFAVLHTDVTQVRLVDRSWGYISAIIDEASREVITIIVTNSANKEQLRLTLDDLAKKLPSGVTPIMHSDQGWQYQTREYQIRLHAWESFQACPAKATVMTMPQWKVSSTCLSVNVSIDNRLRILRS